MFASDLEYKLIKPVPALSDFVESFWMLINHSDEAKSVVIVPDGRIDLFFSYSSTEPYHITLAGLERTPSQSTVLPQTVMLAVSFKLMAVEYVLHTSIADLVDNICYLPTDFWGITVSDLADFDGFCQTISNKIVQSITKQVDERKRQLIERIYSTNGNLTIKEFSEAVHWESRQINRYFNQWFGLSLKAYCNILRFRASFGQIKEGKLFPEQNFTDQAHFIHEFKEMTGMTPRAYQLIRHPGPNRIIFL